MGRNPRTELTEDRIKRVVDAIRSGMSFRRALASQGFHKGALSEWRQAAKAGQESGSPSEFQTLAAKAVGAMTDARSDFEMFHLTNIESHSDDDWRASAWMLAKSFPKQYSDQGRVGTAVLTALKAIRDQDLAKLGKIMPGITAESLTDLLTKFGVRKAGGVGIEAMTDAELEAIIRAGDGQTA